jgi:nucleoid-associated protein Lsr2
MAVRTEFGGDRRYRRSRRYRRHGRIAAARRTSAAADIGGTADIGSKADTADRVDTADARYSRRRRYTEPADRPTSGYSEPADTANTPVQPSRRYTEHAETADQAIHRIADTEHNDTVAGAKNIMAKQVLTLLTDDLDGGEADRTIEFGLDGVNYSIDLSEKNAGKLRKALEPYLSVATRVGRSGAADARGGRRGAVSTGRASRDQNQAIREWATRNGYEVSERGRIPSSIVEAYHSKR